MLSADIIVLIVLSTDNMVLSAVNDGMQDRPASDQFVTGLKMINDARTCPVRE
jgi:hypothetical protein